MEFTSYLLRMGPTVLSKQEVMEMLILVSCDVPDGRFLLFCVKPGGGQLPWHKDTLAARRGDPMGKSREQRPAAKGHITES